MAYTPVPEAWRRVGKPFTVDLLNNIHFNLEDLNSRVSSISLQAGAAILTNSIIEKPLDQLPLGTVIHCSYSEAQLVAEADGGEWVLANGANVAGSDWSIVTGRSTLPDVRGRFLRAKSNGSGNSPTDPALDAYTADSIASHLHSINHGHADTFSASTAMDGNHVHKLVAQGGTQGPLATDGLGLYQHVAMTRLDVSSSNYVLIGSDLSAPTHGYSGFSGFHNHAVTLSGQVTSHTGNSGSAGGSETAPRYVTENAFIKINRHYIRATARLLVFRVPQDVRINDVLVSPIDQGTSGSLVVDIKKGSSPATASQSIFQSGNLPTLPFDASTGNTGLVDSDQNEVAAGQFIVVSVVATQAKLRAFHIYIAGDL